MKISCSCVVCRAYLLGREHATSDIASWLRINAMESIRLRDPVGAGDQNRCIADAVKKRFVHEEVEAREDVQHPAER